MDRDGYKLYIGNLEFRVGVPADEPVAPMAKSATSGCVRVQWFHLSVPVSPALIPAV